MLHSAIERIERLSQRTHPAVGPLTLGVVGLAGVATVHSVDPNEPGNYPTCPWLLLTGTFCPGCGTTRAVHALTHLDPGGALSMNALTTLLLPVFAVGYAYWLYRSFRPSASPPRTVSVVWLYMLLTTVVGFWIVRNLPAASFLAPG